MSVDEVVRKAREDVQGWERDPTITLAHWFRALGRFDDLALDGLINLVQYEELVAALDRSFRMWKQVEKHREEDAARAAASRSPRQGDDVIQASMFNH